VVSSAVAISRAALLDGPLQARRLEVDEQQADRPQSSEVWKVTAEARQRLDQPLLTLYE